MSEQRASECREVADETLLLNQLPADDRPRRRAQPRAVVIAVDRRSGSTVEQRSGAVGQHRGGHCGARLLTGADEQYFLDVAFGERALATGDLDNGGLVL